MKDDAKERKGLRGFRERSSLQSLPTPASSCYAELAFVGPLPLCAPWAASPTQSLSFLCNSVFALVGKKWQILTDQGAVFLTFASFAALVSKIKGIFADHGSHFKGKKV